MAEKDAAPADGTAALTRAHLRRLRDCYASAGWPCHDNLEIDLLAAGLLERRRPDANGVEALRLTDAGLGALHRHLQRNRAGLDAHQQLVARVAQELVRDGRVVFRGVGLRARVGEDWVQVQPDLFSVRNTTHEAHLVPLIHEIKVRRADLLGDLRLSGKRAGYQALSQQFFYVIAEGIADPSEIPEDSGVLVAGPTRLVLARGSPARPAQLGTMHWLQLAKATAEYAAGDMAGQVALGAAVAGPADAQ
jgi:hypothetical protein